MKSGHCHAMVPSKSYPTASSMALSVSIDEASMQWNRDLYVPRAEVHFASALTVAGISARAFRIAVAIVSKIEYGLPKVEDQT